MRPEKMLSSQEKMAEYCTELIKIGSEINLGTDLVNCIKKLVEDICNFKLLIPVIGNFSSGKSSMLNTLLGNKILPIDIRPETAIAIELNYADSSYLEGVTKEGSIIRHAIEELNEIQNSKNEYEKLKLYLNNEKLKRIEPFILVDMPGFDSPNEKHNMALLNYIGYGSYYIVITSVEEGTLPQALLIKLHLLINNGKDFSIFLNKTDLKTNLEINKISEEISNLIQDEFDISKKIYPINHFSADIVINNILAIDGDLLCSQMLVPKLSEICYKYLENINIKIAAIRKTKDEIEAAIAEMSDCIQKLELKTEEDTANIRAIYSQGMADEIVRKVGNELNGACSELVSLAVGGNQGAMERRLNDIVNLALFNAVREKLGEVNMQICHDFSNSIAGLDLIMKDLDLENDFIDKMTLKIQTAFNSINDMFSPSAGTAGIAGRISSSPTLNLGYKTVTGGMLAAGITMPVIGTLLVFLPEILSFLFKSSNKEKARAAIRNKLESEVFPAVKRQVRLEITPLLQKEMEGMITQVRNQYDAMIAEKRDLLIKEASSKKDDSEASSQELQKLEQARTILIQIIRNVDVMLI